jgi:protein-tyrosine kinase
VSFVEKALNRLKQQERPRSPREPLGTLSFEPDQDAPAAAAEAPVRYEPPPHLASAVQADANPTRPPGTRPRVTLDRSRLREEGFLSSDDQERVKAEEYRRIKRPLLANAFGLGATQVEDGNLVLVTSAISGEGKTHTCINLALSLAMEKDRTVLLVDGDVPKPHISRLFGVADQPGLMDALADEAVGLHDLMIRTDIESLRILPAGRWNTHATELLSSQRMIKLCKELASRYPDRIIIFDSPPLLAATEAQAIGAAVGQVVLVIAEGLTARDSVRSALELLDEHKPVNAILNKSRRPQGGNYYGGYHRYGYGDREEGGNAA